MANGFQTFGAILGGGDRMASNAYNTGVVQGAQGADLLEEAASRRNKNVAMAAMTSDLVQRAQSGDPAAQAQLISGAVQAGVNPQQITGAQQDQQAIGWGDKSMAMALDPHADLNTLNRVQIVRSGKPVQLSDVKDGVSLDQYVTPDQNTFTPTAVGQSEMAQHLAAAGASNASAARQYAGIGADKAANYDIQNTTDGHVARINKLTGQSDLVMNPDGTPMSALLSGRGVGTPEKVAPTVYEQNFGKPSTNGGPNAKMQQFQAYRAIHPELDEADALQKFELADQNTFDGSTPLTLADGVPLDANQVTANRTGKPVMDKTDTTKVLARPVVIADAPSLSTALSGGGGGAPPVTTAPVATGGPAMPKSQADFQALPKGAQFINPADGRLMVKK